MNANCKWPAIIIINLYPILGKHLLIDASFPRVPGEKALIRQDFPFFYSTVFCLTFFYRMNGTDVGQLNIYHDSRLIWSLSGNQGDSWKLGVVNILRTYDFANNTVSMNLIYSFPYYFYAMLGHCTLGTLEEPYVTLLHANSTESCVVKSDVSFLIGDTYFPLGQII